MDPYETAVMERIRELLHYRRWLRNDYPFLRAHLEPEYNAELRALLRLARRVRKATRVEARGDHFAGVGR